MLPAAGKQKEIVQSRDVHSVKVTPKDMGGNFLKEYNKSVIKGIMAHRKSEEISIEIGSY